MEQRAEHTFPLAAVRSHATRVYRRLPTVISVVLGAVITYQLAAITQVVLAGSAAVSTPGAANNVATRAPQVGGVSEFAGLADAHLFGAALTTSADDTGLDAMAPTTAPDSTLDVKLPGILFGEGGARSQVIIASAGVEKTYAIGDRIDGAGDAVLRAVYMDRAIIERDGRFETLRLPKEPESAAAAPPPLLMSNLAPEGVMEPEPHPAVEPSPASATSAATPPPLSSIVSVAPGRDASGTGVIFGINLGRHWSAFSALGLKARARVISVNGVALGDDPVAGPRRFREALGAGTTASVMVMNDDATEETIFLDSSRLARP